MAKLLFDEATHTYTIDGRRLPSVTEICAPLTGGRYDNAAAAYAAARGTRIHELCALYDFDALPDEIEVECVPYVRAWSDFCRDWRPTWERVEWQMHDVDGYAGTADRIGLINGRRVIVDIKTAASLDRPAKVSLACQMAGYERAAAEEGLHVDGDSLGVQLKKDGTYTVHSMKKIEKRYGFSAAELFLALLAMHRAVKGDANA